MKIRSDFVTNSSSTAFILIQKSDLTKDGFRRLLGVDPASPLTVLADELFYLVRSRATPIEDDFESYLKHQGDMEDSSEKATVPKDTVEYVATMFSEEITRRVKAAIERGEKVLIGSLKSEGDEVESFFCTDSFEAGNDEYFFSALEYSW